MVSVIIPSYNRWPYVGRAIYSVLCQSFLDIEVIVVDDGSTDESYLVYEIFKDKIKLVKLGVNTGVSKARNMGIRMSHGDYICFLDSDDYWLKDKLQRQLDFMVSNSLSICQTQELWIRNGRLVNPNKASKKPSGHIFAECVKRCYVSPSSVMLKREVLEEVGPFCEELPVAEDYELWLKISSRYPIGLLDEPLVVREMGNKGHLSVNSQGLEYYRIKALVHLLRSWPLNGEKKEVAIQALRHKCMVYGRGCMNRKKPWEARLHLAFARFLTKFLKL